MGFSIKQFYCCGRVKSVSVTIIQHLQENDKGYDKSGCCKTKFQFFKVGENHFASNFLISPDKYFTYLLSLPSYLKIISLPICKAETTNKNHAPPLYSVPAYIFNCVFRI